MTDDLKALSQRMLKAAGQCSKLSVDWDDNGFFYVGGLCVGGSFSGSEGDLIGEQLAAVQLITANVTALIEGYEGEIERLTTSLTAMTQDRNLWADEHNSDCPNVAEIASLREQLAATEETEEKVYRVACYACHNYYVDPNRNAAPVELDGGRWVHGSENSKSGYTDCLAAKYRKVYALRALKQCQEGK